MTGGYLFHRRLADRAPQHDAAMTFVSVPDLPLPWAMATGPFWLRTPELRQADVVVLDSIAAAPAAPWLGGVSAPVVGMLHQPLGGMDTGVLARSVRARFDRWAYGHAALLLVASEWLADQLTVAGISRARLRVVPPGKDPDGAESTQGHDLAGAMADLRQGRRVAALCVANWVPRKGILELLEAVARLPDGLVTLHLVGETETRGVYAGQVRRRLARADLRGRVVVHGVISPASVARMYRAADAFVLPSFEEPYGTVWGEAMAAGLPVLGWRAGNLPFLADDEREGLLAPVGDVRALSEGLAKMALQPERRRQMGRAARERAASRPSWDETADLFFSVIAQVLRERSASQPGEGRSQPRGR